MNGLHQLAMVFLISLTIGALLTAGFLAVIL